MDETSDAMFLNIGNENVGRALAGSRVCRRCGAFVIYLDALDLLALHEAWHQRNDHSGWVPDNNSEHW